MAKVICKEISDKELRVAARALWQQERDNNDHDEPYKFSWYREPALAVLKALKAMN